MKNEGQSVQKRASLELQEENCPHVNDLLPPTGDSEKIPDYILRVLRTCCLIEARGDDYGEFLEEVFRSNSDFAQEIKSWGVEETYHGVTLNWYHRHLFPDYDLEGDLEDFEQAVQLYPDGSTLFRNNSTNEMISRCSVESGTSTLYFSIADECEGKMLEKITNRLARDEIKHFKLFIRKAREFNEEDRTNAWNRLAFVLSRLKESDDQISRAYYHVTKPRRKFSKKIDSAKFVRDLYSIYNFKRVKTLSRLNLQCIYLNRKPHNWVVNLVSIALWTFIKSKIFISSAYIKFWRSTGEIV